MTKIYGENLAKHTKYRRYRPCGSRQNHYG